MLRRLSFLLSSGALWMCAGLAACAEVPEDEGAKQPPPVVGTRSKKPAGQAAAVNSMQVPATTAAGSGMQVITAAPAANSSGVAGSRDAGVSAEEDAGPSAGRGGAAAGSGGTGARAAAGSGGTSGMRAGGSGGRAGAAGSGGTAGGGGQAGGQSDACSGQVCFTVFDCWLLSSADCSYSDCDNFICK